MKLLLDKSETSAAVSLSETTIRRMMLDGRFPRPVHIGSRVLWRATDLEQWAMDLANDDLPEPSKKRGRPRLAV